MGSCLFWHCMWNTAVIKIACGILLLLKCGVIELQNVVSFNSKWYTKISLNSLSSTYIYTACISREIHVYTWFMFVVVSYFLAPAVSQTIKSTKHSSERLIFVTGAGAVGRDCAITDTDAFFCWPMALGWHLIQRLEATLKMWVNQWHELQRTDNITKSLIFVGVHFIKS